MVATAAVCRARPGPWISGRPPSCLRHCLLLLLGLGRGVAGAKLYHFPLFSSSRVVQLVLELGLTDVEIVTLEYRQMKEEPYLSLNPHGTVPAYEEEGLVLLESAAIITHLCERHDAAHRLVPASGRQRARYYQFAMYAPATLYSKAGGLYVHAWEFRPGTDGEARQSVEAIEDSKKWLRDHFVPWITRELSEGPYLLGDTLSAADIIMGWEMMLLGKVGFLQDFPLLQAYQERLASHESWQLTYPAEIHSACVWPHADPACAALHRGGRLRRASGAGEEL